MDAEVQVVEKSIAELENHLKPDNKKEVTDAILYITFNTNDFNWTQNVITKMMDSDNEDVAGLAITCLGHIARIHGKIDKDRVIPLLKEKSQDPRFSGRVEDALNDIDMFT